LKEFARISRYHYKRRFITVKQKLIAEIFFAACRGFLLVLILRVGGFACWRVKSKNISVPLHSRNKLRNYSCEAQQLSLAQTANYFRAEILALAFN
jgi:hypothetical protein